MKLIDSLRAEEREQGYGGITSLLRPPRSFWRRQLSRLLRWWEKR